MNNYFQQKKRTVSLSNPKSTKKHNTILNNSFNDRRQHFIQSLDPAFANCLLNGLYPTSKLPKDITKPITLSKFVTNNQRIQYIVDDFSQSHLPRELYNDGPKIKLRERVQTLEGPQWSYENRPKLRKDQADQANQYNKSIIDDTAKDMSMVYFPQWKIHSKDKWKTDRGFLTTVYPKLAEPQYYTDVYIDGFEVLGDFSRKFEKDELNPKDFRCTIKSSHEPIPSISIRKAMQDSVYNKLYHQNSNPSDFSTNIDNNEMFYKFIFIQKGQQQINFNLRKLKLQLITLKLSELQNINQQFQDKVHQLYQISQNLQQIYKTRDHFHSKKSRAKMNDQCVKTIIFSYQSKNCN